MSYDPSRGMRLDLRQLRYFLAIGDAGTLALAARKLNIAQSAVSHHLGEMEARLGVALVDRHARGVTLTQAGRRLQEHARAILAAVVRAEGDVRSMSQRMAGPVSLGLAHTVTRAIAIPLLRSIKASYPDIQLGLAEALSMPLCQRVANGELDIGVVFNPPEDPRILSQALLEEDIFVIGRAELLGSTADIRFEEVVDLPLIMPHPSATSRSIVDDLYLRNRLPERIMEFDSLFAINHAIIEGIGCGVLARSTAAEALATEGVLARRIVDPTVSRVLHAIHLRDKNLSKAASALRQVVVETIRAEVSGGRWPARPVEAGISEADVSLMEVRLVPPRR